jgi:hypothetical protein
LGVRLAFCARIEKSSQLTLPDLRPFQDFSNSGLLRIPNILSRMTGHAASGQHSTTVVDATIGAGVGGRRLRFISRRFSSNQLLSCSECKIPLAGSGFLVQHRSSGGNESCFGPSRVRISGPTRASGARVSEGDGLQCGGSMYGRTASLVKLCVA